MASFGQWATVGEQGGSSSGDRPEVQLLKEGVGTREVVGTFQADEAIVRAGELSGFAVAEPDKLPDPQMVMSGVVAATAPGPSVTVSYNYGLEHDPDTTPWLLMIYTMPGISRNIIGRDGVIQERMEIAGAAVLVQRTPKEPDYPVFAVLGDTLPLTIFSGNIPEEDVLAMIERMLTR
jgi:hypothetical protein